MEFSKKKAGSMLKNFKKKIHIVEYYSHDHQGNLFSALSHRYVETSYANDMQPLLTALLIS